MWDYQKIAFERLITGTICGILGISVVCPNFCGDKLAGKRFFLHHRGNRPGAGAVLEGTGYIPALLGQDYLWCPVDTMPAALLYIGINAGADPGSLVVPRSL